MNDLSDIDLRILALKLAVELGEAELKSAWAIYGWLAERKVAPSGVKQKLGEALGYLADPDIAPADAIYEARNFVLAAMKEMDE